jgi:lysozyme
MRARIAVASLVLSASALVGLAQFESYTGTAVIPVPGDVPTIGFGTTQGVKMGDKTTPPRALVRLLDDADEYSQAVKRCAPVPMHQHEFDAYVSLAYNIGPGRVGKDGFCVNKEGKPAVIPRRLLAGDYKGACEAILMYGNFKGKPLRGLAKRRQAEYRLCTGAAS